MGALGGIGALSSLAGGAGGKGGGGGGGGGGLDPIQAAATQQSLQQKILGIKSQFANQGIGQSTMETEAIGGANLGAAAQAGGFEEQNMANALNLNNQLQLANTNLNNALGNQSTFNSGGQFGAT
jgi:hypothetical protein